MFSLQVFDFRFFPTGHVCMLSSQNVSFLSLIVNYVWWHVYIKKWFFSQAVSEQPYYDRILSEVKQKRFCCSDFILLLCSALLAHLAKCFRYCKVINGAVILNRYVGQVFIFILCLCCDAPLHMAYRISILFFNFIHHIQDTFQVQTYDMHRLMLSFFTLH